jgi:adenosylmethionine-8-amino-7-oxononanoate aminotransferase
MSSVLPQAFTLSRTALRAKLVLRQASRFQSTLGTSPPRAGSAAATAVKNDPVEVTLEQLQMENFKLSQELEQLRKFESAGAKQALRERDDKLKQYTSLSDTFGAPGFPNVNARHIPDAHDELDLERVTAKDAERGVAQQHHWEEEEWSQEKVRSATEKHVMASWGPTGPCKDHLQLSGGDGIYLIDRNGKRYIDYTSQAVCSNLGHTVPESVKKAINDQLNSVAFAYSGMAIVECRARLAELLGEIAPGDINGFLFPCGGGEANEAAIRMARRYTGRQKIFTQYRSYHGGSSSTLTATGDSRRWFAETGQAGFVKIFNPQPFGFSWGMSDGGASRRSLQALEEQVIMEGPQTIAAVMLESFVGANGVLIPPVGYMEGVRAICDKYGIILILDEVMVGFGRTGELFGFQHFKGVLPDIITSAKGISGAYLPLSMVGCRQYLKDFFNEQPVGWGATYHAHPVAMACGYEVLKYTLEKDLPGNAKALQPVMMQEIQRLVDEHPTVRQGRAVGLFGCMDLVNKEGKPLTPYSPNITNHNPNNDVVLNRFRAALRENGLIGLFRPPLLHVCPPLIITEPELRDLFGRLSKALRVLDEAH